MPHYALKRLERQIKKNSKIYSIKLKSNSPNNKRLENIQFKDGNRNEINSLISTLKLKNLDNNIANYDKILNRLEINTFTKIDDIAFEKLTSDDDKFLKCLLENNHAFFSTICDYISGMSDNYAKKEYDDLY